MNNGKIIKMAEECEACLVYEPNAKEPYSLAFDVSALKAFAEMVITADREQHHRETGAAWRLMCEKMVLAERDRCIMDCGKFILASEAAIEISARSAE